MPPFSHSALTLSILCGLSACPVLASQINILPSSQSYSGLMFTPNAQVIKTGNARFSFHQGVAHNNSIAKLDDWFIAAGVFSGLEVGGRIVTRDYDSHCYTDSCGTRDLSASLKYQLPFIYDYTGVNLAIGAQDIGGAANNFDTKYIVADKNFDSLSLRLSGGYGSSMLANGIMDGPFAGAEWQPLPFIQFTGEYDASAFNANAKLFTPDGFLPWGAQLSLDYQLYTVHENSNQTVWGLNASIPLMGYNFNQKQDLNINSHHRQQQLLNIELKQHATASLNQLISSLKDEGFINLNVGFRENKLIIALENRRYTRNQMDGVGVALGLITTQAGKDVFADLAAVAGKKIDSTKNHDIELILLTNNLPVFSVTTNSQKYRDFLHSGQLDESLHFSSVNAATHYQKTEWLYYTMNTGFGRNQVILSPALRHRTATEYGFFDYSLALSSNLYTPLWQGAAVDLRYLTPISESDDFKPGSYWQNSSYKSEVDRALIHQAFTLPWNIKTQFSAGYLLGNYVGAVNETQWYSPEGHHQLGVEVSQLNPIDNKDQNGNVFSNKRSLLANYTYSVPEYDWQLSLEGGEYWQGDRGARLTSSHWLGDTQLSASYLSSKPKGSNQFEDFLTLTVSIPLTPWREMKPNFIQVRGTDQFSYALQTRIGDSHNIISNSLGSKANLQHGLARQYENRNRLSPAYFKANVQRLRNAYLRYLIVTE